MNRPDVSVVVLAGGRATRFPGKLSADAGGLPLAARVIDNVRTAGPVVLSVARGAAGSWAGPWGCRIVEDEVAGAGPLGGLLSAARSIATPWFYAVAGDAPFVLAEHLAALAGARSPGVEAIVASHGNPPHMQPLLGLYERGPFVREGEAELREGTGSVLAVARRLKARLVAFADARCVASVNTPAEYARYLASAAS